jgi:molybdopterin-guanine dinucleotide biosynthesis protein A
MDALILAGGQTPPEMLPNLDPAVSSPDRGLIRIGNRPMIDYVLDAIRGCPDVGRLAVAGTPAVLAYMEKTAPEVLRIADTGRMIPNAIEGMRVLRGFPNASKLALVTTCDIPLVTSGTFVEFLRGYEAQNLEAAYAITSRAICEAQFPGGRRTYANLSDGDITAGNAIIVEGAIVESLAGEFEHFYKARKNPIAMAKIFGMKFLWKAITKKLSRGDAEAKLSELLGCRAAGVLMKDASIAFDVDKIEDYHVAVTALQTHNATAS